jgi:protein-tyrosine-phosphatase
MRARRVLFVCSGNICRSPMAEGLLRQAAEVRDLGFEVASAGTLQIEGRAAEKNAIWAMTQVGANLSAHRSQGVTPELVAWADDILGMEVAHLTWIHEHIGGAESKTRLFGPFGGTFEIADPMGGWWWDFRRCRDELSRCVDGYLRRS